MITKKVIEPLKCTKTIRTNTEKIFTRLSKLRILYDKEMITKKVRKKKKQLTEKRYNQLSSLWIKK